MKRKKLVTHNCSYSARHKRRLTQKENEKTAKRIELLISDLLKRKESNRNTDIEDPPQPTQVFNNVRSENLVHSAAVDEPINEPEPGISTSERPFIIENVPEDGEAYDKLDDKTVFEDEELWYRYSDCDESDEEVSENNANTNFTTNQAANESISEICKTISSQLTHTYAQWCIECFVSKNAQNKFLRKVRENIPLLHMPLDARTIIKAPRRGVIYQIKGGEYCHFGLESVLKRIVEDRTVLGINNNQIELLINIDGAPTGNDAQKTLWPILCSDKVTKKVYIIGVYDGKASKPKDSNEYMSFFVKEAVFFIKSGLCIDGLQFTVLIDGFIMDAPAKAYVLGVKCHSGYFSCTKCEIKGISKDCICFPGDVATLRTDEKFRKFDVYREQGYQLKKTILTEIPNFDLVNQIPLDPMHLFGVTRKFFLIWRHGATKYRLTVAEIDKISIALIRIKPFVPYEFARKPRDLKNIKQFKATELKEIECYTGPVALQGRVDKKVYDNFVTLHVAISIYSNPILCKIPEWIDYAEQLVKVFVKSFTKLYRSKYVSHNIHNLQHLANDVRRYGELNNFSAFRFEDFIARIKRLLRSGNKVSEQLLNRCAEIELLKEKPINPAGKDVPELKQPHDNGPLPDVFKNSLQYKFGFFFDSYKINCDDAKNNYVYVNNQYYVEIMNIIKNDSDVYVVGRTLEVIGPLYVRPCSSSKLGINILNLKSPSPEIQYWNIKEITAKIFMMPHKNDFVAFPILHTIRSSLQK